MRTHPASYLAVLDEGQQQGQQYGQPAGKGGALPGSLQAEGLQGSPGQGKLPAPQPGQRVSRQLVPGLLRGVLHSKMQPLGFNAGLSKVSVSMFQ